MDVAAGVLDGEGDRAGAGADVEDVDRAWGEGETGEQPVDEVLGLGAGDEDTSVDVEVEAERVEAPLAGDVGDGLAGEAAADEVAEDGAGGLVDLVVEAEVDLHALAAESPRRARAARVASA